jgi:hypothetical protein
MTTTSTPADMVVGIISEVLQMYDKGIKDAYRIIWDTGIAYLVNNWIWVIGILFGVFAFSVLIYIFTGRWGMLGSVLYHYLYFGILFLIGLINGPEAFVSEYFEAACAIILYPLCYLTVRKILEATGIRRRRY